MTGPNTQTGAVGALTDGTGVSEMLASKVLKDFVADILLSGAAALVAVQVMSLQAAIEAPDVVAFALGGALIRTLYRTILRWATTT